MGLGARKLRGEGTIPFEKLNNDKTAIKEGLQKCKVHKNQRCGNGGQSIKIAEIGIRIT